MDNEINGLWLCLAQFLEFIGFLLSLPSMVVMAVSQIFYVASGINNGDNMGTDGQE